MGQAGSTDGGPMGAMEALQQQLDRLEQNLTSLEEDYAERVAGELLDGSKEPSGDLGPRPRARGRRGEEGRRGQGGGRPLRARLLVERRGCVAKLRCSVGAT